MTRHTITGEVRLDNREELFRSLDLPGEARTGTGDLALVLAAYERWGARCPERLLGDFAFLVCEEVSGRAFGARDPLGAKPFYYRAAGRGIAFATSVPEIPAIDGMPLSLDETRVADACIPALECANATGTFYRDVLRLPPGHRLEASGGTVSVTRYWAPDASREIRLGGDAAFEEAFRETFAEAVRCRLEGSTASMLSGGLDSSAIVGFASRIRAREGRLLTTLSAATDEPGCEESHHIRAMLGLAGLDPIVIRPGNVAGFQAEIERFVASIENPFDDAMVLPALMYAAARRRGSDAVLDGLDGDVVASHEPDLLDDLLRGGRFRQAGREAAAFARFYRGTYTPWAGPARLLAGSAARVLAPRALRDAAGPLRRKLGVRAMLRGSIVSRDPAVRAGIEARLHETWSHRSADAAASARDRQARELIHPQIPAALERYHRVAAGQGVEARHPLFDRRVVELCLALPWDQKTRDGWSKRILRTSTAGIIPDEVRWRRGRWVRLGAKFLRAAIAASDDFLAQELGGNLDELAPHVDAESVRGWYRRHLAGDPGAAETVWKAAVLSSWLRKLRRSRYDGAARANGLGSATPSSPRGMTAFPIYRRSNMSSSQAKTEAPRERKSYKQPSLTVYGQLKDLTTGGSGHAQEPGSGKKPRA